MGTTMKLSIAALVVGAGLTACAGKATTDAARQDDFKRDLQLASATSMDLASPRVNASLLTLENAPKGAPEAAKVVRKGAGPRSVRSKAPTVRATPATDVAAVEETTEQATAVSEAPVPEPIQEPVAVAPRPSPVPVIVQAGDGSGDYGTSGSGGGIFGPGGGIGGVIIRGGGVDGDHCEIHGTGRGRTTRGPIYIPGPMSTGGGITIGSRRGGIGMSGMGGMSRPMPSGGSRPSGIGMRRGR